MFLFLTSTFYYGYGEIGGIVGGRYSSGILVTKTGRRSEEVIPVKRKGVGTKVLSNRKIEEPSFHEVFSFHSNHNNNKTITLEKLSET